jgi:hypothetical protein
MLNKAKILFFQIWDAETGEADVVAELKGKKIKAFTLDQFTPGKEYDVLLSLFCREFEIGANLLNREILNTDDKYQVDLKGMIIDAKSDAEEGFVITVDAGNIYVNVYIQPDENAAVQPRTGLFFKGNGRLDIELEHIS